MMSKLHVCLILATLILQGCSSTDNQDAARYEELCALYSGLTHEEQRATFSDIRKLRSAIEQHFPEIAPDLENVDQAPPGQAYTLLQQLIQQKTGQQWHCDAARAFYGA